VRKLCITVMLAALAAAAAPAGDPWKEKPFTKWEEKDIRRIMTDSPWARDVRVDAGWKIGKRTGGPSGAATNDPSFTSQGGTAAANPTIPGVQGLTGRPEAVYFVRWMASRTIRGVLLRGQVTAGKLQAAQAEKLLEEPAPTYWIEISGPDMTPFQGLDEQALAAKTVLKSAGWKQTLTPLRVGIVQNPQDKSIVSVTFHFPRQWPDGTPAIAGTEKSVEFVCQAKGALLKAQFEPAKMRDARGNDW